MNKIIRAIFGLCQHKWKIINRYEIANYQGKPIGDMYISQCEHCGKLIHKRVVV